MKEANVSKELMIECSRLGGICERCNAGTFRSLYGNDIIKGHSTGFPDFICIMPKGVILFVECKATKGTQSPEQKKWQRLLGEIGHKYILYRGNVGSLSSYM